MALTPAPTVRESLEAVVSEMETTPDPVQETPAAEPVVEAVPEAPAQETEEEKAGRTTGRLRDEKGRLLPGKAETAPAVPAKPVIPKAPKPDSWKKELAPQWETLPPDIQAYIGEREKQYQTGVSTYKTEADRAKNVLGAIAEFEPALQQHGIPVDRWIQSLGRAHQYLALGSPEEKLATVQQILANNRIPAQLAIQDEQGQWQLLGQPQQPAITPDVITQTVQQQVQAALVNASAEQEFRAFTEAKDEQGNPKYPHFEEVKATMAGLLQSELAQDYPSAYEAALRMPKHADIFATMQQQQTAKKEAERQAAAQAQVGRARSQAVSVKSSTPSAMTQTEGTKSLRDELSDAFDKRIGGGRV